MSAELAYRIQAQGADELRKIVESVRASDDAVKRAAAGLKDYDAASGRAASSVGRMKELVAANTQAISALTAALQQAKAAQGEAGEGSLRLAAGIGLASAGFTRAIDLVENFGRAAVDLVAKTGNLAEAQANTAARTGLTVKEVGLFEAAAEDAGLSANAYTTAMRTLSRALSENDEEGKRAKRALKDLHVEARDANGVLRPLSAIWVDMANAIGGVEDPAAKARYAMDILGRAGLELLPQLNSEFDNVLTAYRKMGVGFDEISAQTAQRVDSAFDRMTRAVANFQQKLGVAVGVQFGFGSTAEVDAANPYSRSESKAKSTFIGPLFDDAARKQRDAYLAQVAIAKQRAADEAAINATLAVQATLQDKLRTAERERAEAAKTVDRTAFAAADAQVKRIEGQITAQKRATEEARETARILDQVGRQFRAFDDQFSKAAARGTERYAERLSKSSDKIFEGSRRLYDDASLRGELERLRLNTIGAEERLLGPASNRLPSAAAGRAGEFAARVSTGAIAEASKVFDLEQQHRLRMIELTAGPGGELAAAREVYRVRLESAKTELDRQEARVAYEERVAQLAQERLRRYEETAGRVYDSIRQGGGSGGLRSLITGQRDIIGRQVFVNASSSLFQAAGGTLGKIGEASGIGSLLRGTIFDPANAAQPLDKNTLALQRVGGSLDRLTGAITGSGEVPAVLGGDGAYTLPGGGVLQGGTGLIMSLLGRRGATAAADVGGVSGGAYEAAIANSLTAGRIQGPNRLALVGAGAASAYGVYSGVRQGGLGGILTAGGAAAGGIGALIAQIAPASGPAAPILQGVGLAIGLLGSLFGGNRAAKYEERQAAMLNASRYAAPTGRDSLSDGRGGYIDYNARGQVRVIERPVYVEVKAMDSRSFIDARQDIAAAVREAMREGSDLTDTVRAVTHLP